MPNYRQFSIFQIFFNSDSDTDTASESSIGSESDSGSDSEMEVGYNKLLKISKKSSLPFDKKSIENLILQISDRFDFRVVMNDERAKTGLLVTAGLAVFGGLLGRHYGGKVGAAVGGAIGGACGVGIVMVSMRSLWSEIKEQLSEVLELVYEYLSGLGLQDYRKAATFLTKHGCNAQLGMLILQSTSGILGKKILSSLTPA